VIASDIANIEERYARTVVPDALQRVLDAFEAQLHELESGHLYVDSHDPGIEMDLLKQTPSIMRTTSLQGQDLEWHLPDTGRRFWQFQLEALRRGWKSRHPPLQRPVPPRRGPGRELLTRPPPYWASWLATAPPSG
jgi:hypothetical protein